MRSEEDKYYSGSERSRSSRDGKKFRMNDGDWVCPDPQCANVNFARRTSCNRCGKDKIELPSKRKLGHEIGKAAAEKSRGLFSADDWQCGRCGNVNWARRSTCNMCNAPKFGEVEERTGLGGGYNERENVEYIEREESDSEYDDFGRRKKKQKNDDSKRDSRSEGEDSSRCQHPKSDEEEEEEDEEEDGDEGDLSKYDLSGWGDDEDEEKKESGSSGEKKRGGSCSSSSSSSRSSRSSSRSSDRSSGSSSSSSRSRSRSREEHSRDVDDSSRSSSRSSARRRSRSRERFARETQYSGGKGFSLKRLKCHPFGRHAELIQKCLQTFRSDKNGGM